MFIFLPFYKFLDHHIHCPGGFGNICPGSQISAKTQQCSPSLEKASIDKPKFFKQKNVKILHLKGRHTKNKFFLVVGPLIGGGGGKPPETKQ